MNATIFSLLAVTFGFAGLVLWVYWPSRKKELESLGRIPLDDDASSDRRNDE
jgi:cbb3-type cytochrome oxidase subunit 3